MPASIIASIPPDWLLGWRSKGSSGRTTERGNFRMCYMGENFCSKSFFNGLRTRFFLEKLFLKKSKPWTHLWYRLIQIVDSQMTWKYLKFYSLNNEAKTNCVIRSKVWVTSNKSIEWMQRSFHNTILLHFSCFILPNQSNWKCIGFDQVEIHMIWIDQL